MFRNISCVLEIFDGEKRKIGEKMLLPSLYQEFIHLSRYSRWLENKGRRETWEETVDRYMGFFEKQLMERYSYAIPEETYKKVRKYILELKVMPSMRALMTAGPALKRDNVAGYNCAYTAIDKLRAFDEILYILMCGTGVGFSVEKYQVKKLPTVAENFEDTDTTIVVGDSKKGWAKAYRELISLLISGQVPKIDYSKVRPAGARLKVFGGRASGPEPLRELMEFTINTFRNAAGRKLYPIECHDVVCKIAEIVVVGGVRRSALISLSDLNDDRMRSAKSGQWWVIDPHRALANNSVCYRERPDIGTFMEEWLSLYRSKSGERGIFNRQASKKTVEKLDGRREVDYDFGTNPCSEIILRSKEFCNLSEAVVSKDDTLESLMEKVEVAAIIGTWQSTLTHFPYLSRSWKENCQEERLLGVSLTGIMDNELTNGRSQTSLKSFLPSLKERTLQINEDISKKIGINPSASITCIKPSGTVSQLVNAASGIHARHSEYYIRTVRGDKKDPLAQFMVDMGFPHEDCVMKPEHQWVFSFPVKSPENAVFRNDMSAIEQLELWLDYQRHWCEHKPSVTISVKEHEWFEVGSWVWKHFDEVSGVSFLPSSDHTYKQAPYQDCGVKEYEELLAKIPKDVDWSGLVRFEKEDNTKGAQTYSCTAGSCEIVDLTD